MQKPILTLTLAAILLVSLSACQPKSDEEQVAEPIQIIQEQKRVVKPKSVITDSALDAKTCLALNKAMQQVDHSSKIEAIYAIQKQLKSCLPTANNAEVMDLLKSYQTMYNRFLTSEVEVEEDDFNSVIYELYYGDGITSKQLESLSPRAQYLVKLAQSDADVSIRGLGEGFFTFGHDLTAMADLFLPYLRKDQAAFIERMAQDNQDIFWSDASITVPFDGLIERATFWENYLQRYPKGYAAKDAQLLLDLYRYTLFYGSGNTQWTDDAIHKFMEPKYKQMIVQLSKRPDSILAKDAQKYLSFLVLSDSERQQQYPAPSIDEDGYEMSAWSIAYYQLDKALQIPSIWDTRHYRDCLNGVFCEDEIDFDSLDVSSTFASACPSIGLGDMQLQEDLTVWGFGNQSSKPLRCEPLNLRDYSQYECDLDIDWHENPTIDIYNDSGSYKNIYANLQDCELALK